MTHGPIGRAQPGDERWIAELIGAAFFHLKVVEWLVPDPAQRARVLPGNFEIFVAYGLAHGEVHVTADQAAVAVWIPRGYSDLPPPDDYDARLARACRPWTDRFVELDRLFEKFHPEPAHHHLAFLAVHPDRQGAGHGSALLRHYHHRLDAQGEPAFLEASSTGSRDLYLRHGYRLLHDPYAAPNGALFWPMWRDPQPAS
ncbi:MAG TPA: GNAT family N-acetyltransferase [Micromonosporaceae bacterium]